MHLLYRGFAEGTTCLDLLNQSSGLCEGIQSEQIGLFGPNHIDIEVKSIPHLIFYEALNPFYMFQLYTSIIWMIQLYWMFTTAIIIMSMTSIAVTIWETRRVSLYSLSSQILLFILWKNICNNVA